MLVLALVPALITAGPALAGGPPVECNGTFTGYAPGNLVVPAGDFCLMQNATVGNNVLVEPNAIGLSALGGNTIGGSVLSPGPIVFDVRVLNDTVGKDVVVQNTRPGTAGGICRSQIGGNVILQNNAGFMNVGSGFPQNVCPDPTAGNHIAGNLIVDDNSGGNTLGTNTIDRSVHVDSNSGFEEIFRNTIGDTLQCENNTGLVISSGNTANNFAGQCQS